LKGILLPFQDVVPHPCLEAQVFISLPSVVKIFNWRNQWELWAKVGEIPPSIFSLT